MDSFGVCAPGHSTVIRICRSGHNPTKRRLLRLHDVSVVCLHEVISRLDMSLEDLQSQRQTADINAKAFVDA